MLQYSKRIAGKIYNSNKQKHVHSMDRTSFFAYLFLVVIKSIAKLESAGYQRLEQSGPRMGSQCRGAGYNYSCCFAPGILDGHEAPTLAPVHHTCRARHGTTVRPPTYYLLSGDDSASRDHEFSWPHSELIPVICNGCPGTAL